jgi:hypothetical protein
MWTELPTSGVMSRPQQRRTWPGEAPVQGTMISTSDPQAWQ